MKYKLSEIINAISGILIKNVNLPEIIDISEISTDTRHPKKIFIAFKGERYDAHNFLETLPKQELIVVSNKDLNLERINSSVLLVEDTYVAYQKIANFHRNHIKAKICGITGSVGKTTSKNLLAYCLSRSLNIFATEKNFNNQIGVPMSILNLKENHQYGVFELGTNKVGEIDILSKTLEPEIAIVTNISHSHTKFFNTMNDLVIEKGDIINYLKPRGKVILCTDHGYFDDLEKRVQSRNLSFFTYGLKGKDVKLISSNVENMKRKVEVEINNQIISYTLHYINISILYASLMTLCFYVAENLDYTNAIKIFEGIPDSLLEGRGQIIEKENCRIIDDSYNGPAESFISGLQMLKAFPGKKIAILGQIGEVGEEYKDIYKLISPYTKGIDIVITIGEDEILDLFLLLNSEIKYHFASTKELFEDIKDIDFKNSTILLKGANFHKLWELIEYFN